MTLIEFRDRSSRAPGGELRIFVGRSAKRGEVREFQRRRDILNRLATRGEYDVLQAIKSGNLSVTEVVRLVDDLGIQDYRSGLRETELEQGPVTSLSERIPAYLRTVKNPKTRALYKRRLARLENALIEDGGVAVRAGVMPWHRIRRHHIRGAKQQVEDLGLADWTVQGTLGAWSAFFEWAIDHDESEAELDGREPLTTSNPVRRAKVWLKVGSTRHRFLSEAEFDRMLEVAPAPMRAQVATLVLCGLRIDEFMQLPREHMDVTRRIHIGPFGDWAPKGYPRSENSVRDVPVHQAKLRPLLEEYQELYAGERQFFVNPQSGERWTYESFRYHFDRIVKAAGMDPRARRKGKRNPDGVTPHTCRHTLASWLVQADVQLMKVAAILGDSLQTIQKHYAHLRREDAEKAINTLELSDLVSD